MTEATARAIIKAHFDASNVGVAGGGPDDDIVRASEIYADDAVVEWPQGGERLVGKANIIAMRSTYPTRQQFELHRTTGCHDLWVNEYTIRYDDQTVMVVGIMEFRDDKVVRERIYFGDPWTRRPGARNGSSGSTLWSRTRRSRRTSQKRSGPTEHFQSSTRYGPRGDDARPHGYVLPAIPTGPCSRGCASSRSEALIPGIELGHRSGASVRWLPRALAPGAVLRPRPEAHPGRAPATSTLRRCRIFDGLMPGRPTRSSRRSPANPSCITRYAVASGAPTRSGGS